jgi:hypothetical protein
MNMLRASQTGIASGGVQAPERRMMGATTTSESMATWGMVRASEATMRPRPAMLKMKTAVQAKKSRRLPRTGTWITGSSRLKTQRAVPARRTSMLAVVLASRISTGVTGETRSCSMVPCSRSRMSVAAGMRIARNAIIESSSLTAS